MKRVFYRSHCAVLCVSMLGAAMPVKVIAEEGWRQENTSEQFDTGAADNSGGSMTGGIDTSEIGNESIKSDSYPENPVSHRAEPQVSLTSDMSPDTEQATRAKASEYQHSDSATCGSVTLTVEWNDAALGQPMTFYVSATGGSGSFSAWMRPRTLTPTSTSTSRSPTQAAESGQSTPTRALATTLRSQRRLPDHITSAFTSWTKPRAFTICAPSLISRLRTMRIPALRVLLIGRCCKPSKRKMVLNTKWPSTFMNELRPKTWTA